IRAFHVTGVQTCALPISLASYAVYCCYDVLGKAYAGHNLPIRQVVPITFVCYAFNLNLSAWVGGIALRYRLYSRLGLRASQITQIGRASCRERVWSAVVQ